MQPCSIKRLTEAVVETAAKQGSLQEEATTVKATFEKLLSLFAKCHDTYSRSAPITDMEIDQFSKCPVADT